MDALSGGDGIQEDDLVQSAVLDALHGGAGQHAVGGAGGDGLGVTQLHQSLGSAAQGSAGVHHVVEDDDPLVGNVADDVHDLGGIGLLTALIHDGQGHAQLLGKGAGAGHGAHVGGNHHQLVHAVLVLLGEVLDEHGGAQQVIHGDIEEAQDLVGVEVHGQHAVSAGAGDEVGHQLGGDGIAGLGLAVLTGVAEVRHNGGDTAGGGPLEGVDHDEHFHQVIVDGRAGGLNDEEVSASHRFADVDARLPVRELADFDVAQRRVKLFGDRLGKGAVGIAGKELDFVTVCDHFVILCIISGGTARFSAFQAEPDVRTRLSILPSF